MVGRAERPGHVGGLSLIEHKHPRSPIPEQAPPPGPLPAAPMPTHTAEVHQEEAEDMASVSKWKKDPVVGLGLTPCYVDYLEPAEVPRRRAHLRQVQAH